MLDVHPPHEPIHGWKDFLLHLLTITIGLLIALGLEGSVEWFHHRSEVAEAREALHVELVQNQDRFAANTDHFRKETAMLQTNLAIFRYLHDHLHATADQLPGTVQWNSSNATMQHSAWDSARQRGITAFMPGEEVMRKDELYSFFDRIDKAHEDEADAIAEAVSYMFEGSNPSQLTLPQLDREIELTKRVLSKHLRHAYLMQNLAEEFQEFRPGPTREELNQMLKLSN